MRLASAAKHFDNTLCLEGYDGLSSLRGQFSLYDGSKRDAEVTSRNVLSLAPEVVVPPRRVISVDGVRFILGHGTPDHFKGRKLRVGYVAHEATHLAHIRTLAQVSLGQAGTLAWAGESWVKNLAYTEQTSDLPRQKHIHLSRSENISPGYVALLGSRHYLVREVDDGPAGLRVALADEMVGDAVQDVTFSSPTFDPVTETYSGPTTPARVVQVSWQSLFSYGHRDAPDFGPEDVQLVVAKATLTPKPGMCVQALSGKRYIESVMGYGDTWLCRAVLHA